MLVQEAAEGPLRWSSSQAASYIIKKFELIGYRNRGTCIDACIVWWRDTLLSASRYKALLL